MAHKIKPENISKMADKIIQKHAYKNGTFLHLPMYDGISIIAAYYFWMPIYKMLVKAELIDSDLIAGEFMIQNEFAVSKGKIYWPPIDEEREVFDLTCMGFDLLANLIDEVNWLNIIPSPPGDHSSFTVKNSFIKQCYPPVKTKREKKQTNEH
ncbi:MAG: hypothetical protein JWR05_378 [Mucilaginibacter sp.]|nr:hypothetical protein [Mucilaginibacter sp.]